MRHTVVISALASFLMAIAGTAAANGIPALGLASAQESRLRGDSLTVMDSNGQNRVEAYGGLSPAAGIRVLAPDGTTNRALLGTGGNQSIGGQAPQTAGTNVA